MTETPSADGHEHNISVRGCVVIEIYGTASHCSFNSAAPLPPFIAARSADYLPGKNIHRATEQQNDNLDRIIAAKGLT